MQRLVLLLILAMNMAIIACAQQLPIKEGPALARFPSASSVHNRITTVSGLDSFYYKLFSLKKNETGRVNIVHIGDSHTQGDFLTAIVRDNLQEFFGNSGRGLVFPYQLAKSNAPADISSSSNTTWQYNRIAHPEIAYTPGISGFVIQSNATGSNINLRLKPTDTGNQSFNRLRIFTDDNSSNSWSLHVQGNVVPFVLKNDETKKNPYHDIEVEFNSDEFTLSSLPSDNTRSFYGVSLENDDPGILVHTIGVNGARYDQYNKAELFWKQLPALEADLYIVSLGTNEAQGTKFDAASFKKEISEFAAKIHSISPNAAIIITTAADSYKRGRPNLILKQVNAAITSFCTTEKIPLWDLYRITNGHGSAYTWSRRGLLNRDRVHYTVDGYRVQGYLLYSAIAKGYNSFLGTIK